MNSTIDVIADDGVCTLREAIIAANTDAASGGTPGECAAGAGADTITLSAGTYTLDIDGDDDTAAAGDLDITAGSDVTIIGAISTFITACATPRVATPCAGPEGTDDRLFHVLAGGTLTLERMNLRYGYAAAGWGGGVYVAAGGTLHLQNNASLTGNAASVGGGIASDGTTTITGGIFGNNEGTSDGGALFVGATGVVTITTSFLSGNQGNISSVIGTDVGAQFSIDRSLLHANEAATDIHLNHSVTAVISNTTISGSLSPNSVLLQEGNLSDATLTNVTITGSAGRGVVVTSGTMTVRNSIIAGSALADCDGATVVQDSLIEDGTCGAPLSGDPMLGALASNGGPTQTHALLPGSPAINAGDNAVCAAAPVSNVDQRGVARPAGGTCDVGAYEYSPASLAFTVDNTADAVDAAGDGVCAAAGGDCHLRAAIQEANTWGVPTTITLPAGTYTLTIPTTNEDASADGDLDVVSGSEITIQGAGSGSTFVEACQAEQVSDCTVLGVAGVVDRVFDVAAGGVLTIEDMTVRHGRGEAAAILNQGAITIARTVIAGNHAPGARVIQNSFGQMVMTDSTVSGNAGSHILFTSNSLLDLSRVTISGNTPSNRVISMGGAASDVRISNVTIADHGSPVAVLQATSNGNLAIMNSTITSDGPVLLSFLFSDVVTISNSILWLNGVTCAVSGTTIGDGGNNVMRTNCGDIQDGDAEGNIGSLDPGLEPLAWNGGYVQTRALLPGSPAINAGNNAVCAAAPVNNVDQRGVARPVGGTCDIGAYEYNTAPTALVVDDLGDAADANAGDGVCATAGAVCTLRAAVQEANSWGAATTITFSVSGTINVGSVMSISSTGLTVDGEGQSVILNGGNASKIFVVPAGQTLEVRRLTFEDGSAANGGAIEAQSSTLTVRDSTFRNNTATTTGGALRVVSATLAVTGSSLSGNDGGQAGGAISIEGASTATIANTTISGNSVAQVNAQGGGIFVGGGGTATLTNVTITGNTALSGGGLRNLGTTNIRNTLIAGNTATTVGPDCTGTPTSQGNNLIGDTTGCAYVAGAGDLLDTAPLLGPLASNGGATQTHALLANSPAIDAGDNAGCAAAPVNGVDQRGTVRPQGAACDIGAYEAAATAIEEELPPTITLVIPPGGGVLQRFPVRLEFPADALPEGTTVTLEVFPGEVPALPPGVSLVTPASMIRITATLADGTPLASFGGQVSLTLTLGPSLLQAGPYYLMVLVGGEWLAVPALVDPVAGVVRVHVTGPALMLLGTGGPLVQGDPPAGGLGLVQVGPAGLSLPVLHAILAQDGCPAASAWVTVGGKFLGYIFGAPDVVNANFPPHLSAGTPLIARCG